MAHAKEERAVRVLLATTSPQKQEAVERAFQLWKRPVELHAFKAVSGIPEQPVGNDQTLHGALNRIKHAKDANKDLKWDLAIAVENGLQEPVHGIWLDVGWIVVENAAGKRVVMTSPGFTIPTAVVEATRARGCATTTIGDILHEQGKSNQKDVHAWILGNFATRATVLADTILLALYQISLTDR